MGKVLCKKITLKISLIHSITLNFTYPLGQAIMPSDLIQHQSCCIRHILDLSIFISSTACNAQASGPFQKEFNKAWASGDEGQAVAWGNGNWTQRLVHIRYMLCHLHHLPTHPDSLPDSKVGRLCHTWQCPEAILVLFSGVNRAWGFSGNCVWSQGSNQSQLYISQISQVLYYPSGPL